MKKKKDNYRYICYEINNKKSLIYITTFYNIKTLKLIGCKCDDFPTNDTNKKGRPI